MKKNNWDWYAPVYNLFMRKDKKAYERMYKRIRKVIANKEVLELATGTGLIAKNVAEVSFRMEATDFSAKMIEEACKGECPGNLNFRVADACHLPYEDASYDVVVISNALHIMPEPVKALEEIKRVLNKKGILIAPTFTHGEMSIPKKLFAKVMGVTGFRTENKWTTEEYAAFLEENGWQVKNKSVLKASFPLTYVECVRKNNG